jgi:L-asparaginase II
MKSRSPLIVEVTRGPLIESTHEIIAAVADKRKTIVGYAGQLDYVISPRSSIKPLQALPLLESGAFEHYKLSERHLVLACASHKAEPHHMEALNEWLKIIGKDESVLRCGPADKSTSPLTNNCSGKHLGMISTAMYMKMDPAYYDKFEHPYQDFLRKYLTEVTGIDFTKAPHGVDGCCIPTYGMTVQKLALGMSVFVQADDNNDKRRRYYTRILEAIKKYPEYLSGKNDFAHNVIETTNGRAILKTGAEGAYTGIMPEQGLAFALKAIDGSSRAAEVAVMHLFKAYGALSPQDCEKLKKYIEPDVLNTRKEKVGVIRMRSVPQ